MGALQPRGPRASGHLRAALITLTGRPIWAGWEPPLDDRHADQMPLRFQFPCQLASQIPSPIQFDSIQFDSIRFDSIESSTLGVALAECARSLRFDRFEPIGSSLCADLSFACDSERAGRESTHWQRLARPPLRLTRRLCELRAHRFNLNPTRFGRGCCIGLLVGLRSPCNATLVNGGQKWRR